MMNLVIPMAGKSSSFTKEGVNTPKPYLKINGLSMVHRAYLSLNLDEYINKAYFIALDEHREKYNVAQEIEKFCDKSVIIYLPEITSGPAETISKLEGIIPGDEPMLQSNVDQVLDWESSRFIEFLHTNELDAALVTINTVDPHYSFARYDKNRIALNVTEKQVISNEGLIGTHYWKKASDYFRSYKEAKKQGLTYNDETYVSHTFNPLIQEGKIVRDYKLKQLEKQHVIGSPKDLERFSLLINYE